MQTSEFLAKNTEIINKQLFGRDKEIKQLQKLYKQVERGGFEVVFVSGLSGTGKTVLVREAIKPLLSKNIFFIYGKCNQYTHQEPYVPFIEALRMLINQILTEPKDIMQRWRQCIINTIGENCAVLIDMIPELELIIGQVPKLKTSNPKKLKARLETSLKKMIHLFTTKEHPLVMVFDDLQWADPATLQLMKVIMSDASNHYLFLINIYRTREPHKTLLLEDTLESLDSMLINRLSINSLTFNDSKALLEHTYNYTQDQIFKLSKLIYRKTLGNPFYIEQIITVCKRDMPLMTCNEDKLAWMIEYINKLIVDDNVLNLVINRLKMLSKELVQLLIYASHLGRKFDIKTLMIILENTQEQIYDKVKRLMDIGVFIPSASMSHYRQQHSFKLTVMEFEFSHDHIQQAAYQLTHKGERKNYHLYIGRALLANLEQSSIENKLIYIMSHFNEALDLIDTNIEREKIISLNLLAAKKVKASAAYRSALEYLRSGITLLPKNAWETNYNLCFDLHFELAECEFLCNNFDKSEMMFQILISQIINKTQKADIYGKRAILYSCMGQYREAIKTGIIALESVGVHIPKKVMRIHILKEIVEALWKTRNSKFSRFEKIISSPPKRVDKVIELLNSLVPSANIIDKDLFNLLILKIANISGKYGSTQNSSIGYSGYAIVVGSILGNFKKADKFEELALSISKSYNDKGIQCIVYFIIGVFVHQWTHDARENIQLLEKAYELGLESGDNLFVGYSIITIIELNLSIGKSLNEIEELCEKHFDYAKFINIAINSITMIWELVKYLQYENETGDYFFNNQDFEKELIKKDKNEIVNYYLYKTQILYLFGNYEEAFDEIERAVKKADSVKGYLYSVDINFYHSLTLIALCCCCSDSKKKFIKKIIHNQKQMKKWSENSPNNFKHKYLLIEAELNRCLHNETLAAKLYDKAIKLASDSGFIQDVAIANECAANYYLFNDLQKVGIVYLNEAYINYQRWGANRKANNLMKKYKFLTKIKSKKEKMVGQTMSDIIEAASITQEYDSMVVEYLQDMMDVTDANSLLSVFLSKMMALSKANRGYVFIESNDDLYIEAFKEPWYKSVKTNPKGLMEKRFDFPKKIIRYTARTYKDIIINPQDQINIFNNDPYIIERENVTLASIPLMLNNIFIGLLYLENTEHTSQFTAKLVGKVHVLTKFLPYIKKGQTLFENETSGVSKPTLQQPLSKREIEVLILISHGKTNKQIAEELHLAMNTVKSHISNIYGKLEVNRRIHAVMRAREMGILQ